MDIVLIKSNLKRILKDKEMTPYRLAKDWNKNTNHVYKMAKCEYWPEHTRLITLIELAQLLNVPVDHLFSFDNGS